MGIIGPRPESGARFELRRHDIGRASSAPDASGAPDALAAAYQYTGAIVLPEGQIDVLVTVLHNGDIDVHAPLEEPWRERVRRLLRTVTRAIAHSPPPRTITRWRPEQP